MRSLLNDKIVDMAIDAEDNKTRNLVIKTLDVSQKLMMKMISVLNIKVRIFLLMRIIGYLSLHYGRYLEYL